MLLKVGVFLEMLWHLEVVGKVCFKVARRVEVIMYIEIVVETCFKNLATPWSRYIEIIVEIYLRNPPIPWSRYVEVIVKTWLRNPPDSLRSVYWNPIIQTSEIRTWNPVACLLLVESPLYTIKTRTCTFPMYVGMFILYVKLW